MRRLVFFYYIVRISPTISTKVPRCCFRRCSSPTHITGDDPRADQPRGVPPIEIVSSAFSARNKGSTSDVTEFFWDFFFFSIIPQPCRLYHHEIRVGGVDIFTGSISCRTWYTRGCMTLSGLVSTRKVKHPRVGRQLIVRHSDCVQLRAMKVKRHTHPP